MGFCKEIFYSINVFLKLFFLFIQNIFKWLSNWYNLYITRTTLMSPGKGEIRVCGYMRSEFIHWALWRTLMRTEYFLFVHHTTSILAKLNTWCFEYSGDISCFLLANPSHTDESWEGRNTCMGIYIDYIYIYRQSYVNSNEMFL